MMTDFCGIVAPRTTAANARVDRIVNFMFSCFLNRYL